MEINYDNNFVYLSNLDHIIKLCNFTSNDSRLFIDDEEMLCVIYVYKHNDYVIWVNSLPSSFPSGIISNRFYYVFDANSYCKRHGGDLTELDELNRYEIPRLLFCLDILNESNVILWSGDDNIFRGHAIYRDIINIIKEDILYYLEREYGLYTDKYIPCFIKNDIASEHWTIKHDSSLVINYINNNNYSEIEHLYFIFNDNRTISMDLCKLKDTVSIVFIEPHLPVSFTTNKLSKYLSSTFFE